METRSLPFAAISPEMMIPDLIKQYPSVRSVFDRYGLSGCGGHHGPVESIRFFARAHGVDESQLLSDLQQATTAPAFIEEAAAPSIADTIYRRFFVGGMILVLSAGATWGAYILWQIAFRGTFISDNSLQEINAHGHAQIYGWVGLFIMGFAYQAFPRIWHTTLIAPRLAVTAFVMMVIGITIRSVGMALHNAGNPALLVALFGAALEIGATLIFVTQILLTFRRSLAKIEPYVGFVLAALAWFTIMSLWDAWHMFTTMHASTPADLLWHVATYQAPLRDMQIHGLALCMILGVCLRMLPGLFDVTPTSNRSAWTGLALINMAVLGEVVLFVAYRWSDNHLFAAALMLPWLLLIGGISLVVWPWKLWRAFKETDRSAKFIRTGYLWLAISLLMLLMLPIYQAAYTQHIGQSASFSHAYYGAIRHAITVGFVSLMIMGFAAKVVPTLNGLDTRKLSALWGPFILVNIGCFLRVSLQTLTDWDPRFFPILGISGTLEVIGLAWWSLHLIRIIRQGKRETLYENLQPLPPQIEPNHHVADVLSWFPATESVFVRHGFSAIRNPLLRRTLARQITIAQAAKMHGVSLDDFIIDLNRTRQQMI